MIIIFTFTLQEWTKECHQPTLQEWTKECPPFQKIDESCVV